jgi:hypothetical protein
MVKIGERRGVALTLKKKVLAQGQLVLWWPAMFKGDPEIDVSQIKERSESRKKTSASFMDAFKQAQETFKERAKSREKIEVDIGDGGDVEGEGEGDGGAGAMGADES